LRSAVLRGGGDLKVRIHWKQLAEIVGVVAIVASLVFVGLQLRQTQEIARSQVLSANVGNRIEANIAIADHATLWDKASSGAELSTAEEVVIDRLIDNVSVERVALWLHFLELGLDDDAELILADFAGFLYRYPGIYHRYMDRERGFVADRTAVMDAEHSLQYWVEAMRARVEKIERASNTRSK
jgi:hypothetical protein